MTSRHLSIASIVISFLAECYGSQGSPAGSKRKIASGRSRAHRAIDLIIEYVPLLNEDTRKPDIVDGKVLYNYIPSGATVDRQNRLEIRTDVLVRTDPATPHRYFGRLRVLKPTNAKIITSDRIVTDREGVFRATLSTKFGHSGGGDLSWKVRIDRAPGT